MSDLGLQQVWHRLSHNLIQNQLVQTTTNNLRNNLNVDRVVLYYFYSQWQGRVTFESIRKAQYSIFGSTGPDECFNNEYAAMYRAGRVSAIENIENAEIAPCHRNFLQQLQVKANLVVPILNEGELWGLLIAHQCQSDRIWLPQDVQMMQQAAGILAEKTSIKKLMDDLKKK
jgi:GAF domain-containing protein